jgi:hypothetical protein
VDERREHRMKRAALIAWVPSGVWHQMVMRMKVASWAYLNVMSFLNHLQLAMDSMDDRLSFVFDFLFHSERDINYLFKLQGNK